MPSILDDPEFTPSKSILEDPEFTPAEPKKEPETMTPEEVERFLTYGPQSKSNLKSLIKDDRSFLEKKLPDENIGEKFGNTVGAMIHGGFDSASYGAGHRLLDDLAEKLGGARTFEARKKVFERTAPWAFGAGGLGTALYTPGGAQAAEYVKSAPGALAKLAPKTIERLAKAAGIGVDALQAALYNYNTAKKGEEFGEAGKGAAISTGMSLGLPIVGKALNATGTKFMDWFFGLPPEIQNKIKSNPDILNKVASQEEIGQKITTALENISQKGIKASKEAGEKLSNYPGDFLTPERLRNTISSVQEEMGPTKGLKLKESAFNRLEGLKELFPENKVFTPRQIKPLLQDIREEAFEKTTEGPTKEALKDVQNRLDAILKENSEYLQAMRETSLLTRLGESVRKRTGLKEMQNLETGAREFMPTSSTYSMIRGSDKTGMKDRILDLLSKKSGVDISGDVEKLRMANFLSQPRSNQNTGARMLIPAIGAITGITTGGLPGLAAGGGAGVALDKYGRRLGAEMLGQTATMGKFLDENKLFKEFLDQNSKLNKKYAASHFIRSQVDPEYNKENSK